ncbi:MAG TPA: hypothetical protein PLE35_09735 [Lentisphaeria bacterium]|nr:hypothetical protein [Lentisphaeria bacterium]
MNESALDRFFHGVPTALFLVALIVIAVLYVYSFIWIYRDAEVRNKSGCLVVLALFFITPWPFGLLVWLACRPRLADIYPASHDDN